VTFHFPRNSEGMSFAALLAIKTANTQALMIILAIPAIVAHPSHSSTAAQNVGPG
jgi:hypothetical protein